MLYHIAYVSSARRSPSTREIEEILEVSRRNNARDGITGLLLTRHEQFFQILEGEKAAVEACYARIARDRRHTELALIWEDEIAGRAFPDWEMGISDPTQLGEQAQGAVKSLTALSGGGARLSDRADPGVGILLNTILAEFR